MWLALLTPAPLWRMPTERDAIIGNRCKPTPWRILRTAGLTVLESGAGSKFARVRLLKRCRLHRRGRISGLARKSRWGWLAFSGALGLARRNLICDPTRK